jgi:hypothetical protein
MGALVGEEGGFSGRGARADEYLSIEKVGVEDSCDALDRGYARYIADSVGVDV